MKTAIKFLTAAFVFALSLANFTALEAQTKALNKERIPAPTLTVTIKVVNVSIGVYTLEAMVKDERDDAKKPVYRIEWYKNGSPFDGGWILSEVGYGKYTVVIKEMTEHRWGEAGVDLLPPSTKQNPWPRM